MHQMVQQVRETYQAGTSSVKNLVRMRGGASGGTIHTGLALSAYVVSRAPLSFTAWCWLLSASMTAHSPRIPQQQKVRRGHEPAPAPLLWH